MKINMTRTENTLVVALEGRLDTITAPELEQGLRDSLTKDVTELIFDFEALDYISSAGLRTMMLAYKEMRDRGTMRIVHVNEIVGEVFEVTGFSKIMNIQ